MPLADWEALASALSSIILISGAMAGLIKIVTSWEEIKERFAKRRRRHEALNKLAGLIETLEEAEESRRTLYKQMGELSNNVNRLAQLHATLKVSNAEHARAIRESLAERRLISKALIGLLDHAIQSGANGPITDAHKQLSDFLHEQAYRWEK